MLNKDLHKTYRVFDLPLKYEIDKNELKDKYYDMIKKSHPDALAARGSGIWNKKEASTLNNAYAVLSDDFMRAKLFTTPSSKIDQQFLGECLDLEDRINEGEPIAGYLDERIAACRNNYTSPEWVSKWAYYERLKKLFNNLKKL
ncbi:molecular chaperone HscB [Enteropsectra breve]|nr:molecular chaperone HscB [Enteropsectra breve]